MALTAEQQAVMKADILASPDLNIFPNTADGAYEIALLYNLPSSPAFIVWRSDVPTHDAKTAMVWTEYIGRSAAERDAWQFMLSNGYIDASDVNVRQGIQDIFSGPQGATTRANLVAMAKRTASRVEALFATGTGSDADPGTAVFIGTVNHQDVHAARNS